MRGCSASTNQLTTNPPHTMRLPADPGLSPGLVLFQYAKAQAVPSSRGLRNAFTLKSKRSRKASVDWTPPGLPPCHVPQCAHPIMPRACTTAHAAPTGCAAPPSGLPPCHVPQCAHPVTARAFTTAHAAPTGCAAPPSGLPPCHVPQCAHPIMPRACTELACTHLVSPPRPPACGDMSCGNTRLARLGTGKTRRTRPAHAHTPRQPQAGLGRSWLASAAVGLAPTPAQQGEARACAVKAQC